MTLKFTLGEKLGILAPKPEYTSLSKDKLCACGKPLTIDERTGRSLYSVNMESKDLSGETEHSPACKDCHEKQIDEYENELNAHTCEIEEYERAYGEED